MDIFCQIKEKFDNQIIHETSNFYVFHDGFPLLEGHLLIIPKKHILCFLELEKDNGLKQEYLKLKNKVKEFLKDNYIDPVFFEHGKIAQTILHAHLHALPTKVSLKNELDKIGSVMKNPKIPYLFYEENNKSYFYQVNKNIDDGFLHYKYAEKLNRPKYGKSRAMNLNNWLLKVKENWGKL